MLKSTIPHITLFGSCNVGKSTLFNKLLGQNKSIVSEVPGTTTDPHSLRFEITDIGPVQITDTAGVDDESILGEPRQQKTKEAVLQSHLVIFCSDKKSITPREQLWLEELRRRKTSVVWIQTKSDLKLELGSDLRSGLAPATQGKSEGPDFQAPILAVGRETPAEEILSFIKKHLPKENKGSLLGEFVKYGDHVLLVTPIDSEAPYGRLIQPQVHAIRDALDQDAVVTLCKEKDIETVWRKFSSAPDLVVTDSQCFLKVEGSIPPDCPLTSFSILMARLKGDLNTYYRGAQAIGQLQDGDAILISETCSHHQAPDDIGRVKIPRWLSKRTGKNLQFSFSSGNILQDFKKYKLIIQCGGCMSTRQQIMQRIYDAERLEIPITNYGLAIAYCHGILNRATEIFFRDVF